MNVLITGGSRGIGRSLALEFVRKGDDRIFIISRSADRMKKIQEEGKIINPRAEIIPIPFDINQLESEDVPAPLKDIHIDILVNNAGLLVNKDFEELEANEMKNMMLTNLIAPAMLIQKLLSGLGGELSSHIVNIGSMGGFQGSAKFRGLSIYSATKAALASLTECLAEEFRDRNIFVNCLAIGAVQTEMLKEAFPGFQAPVSPEDMAGFIADFAGYGYKFFNGKILPVSVSTP